MLMRMSLKSIMNQKSRLYQKKDFIYHLMKTPLLKDQSHLFVLKRLLPKRYTFCSHLLPLIWDVMSCFSDRILFFFYRKELSLKCWIAVHCLETEWIGNITNFILVCKIKEKMLLLQGMPTEWIGLTIIMKHLQDIQQKK